MSWLNKLKSTDQRHKDLIFGYIRRSSKSISSTTIPVLINYVCLLYCLVNDKFIECQQEMEITSSDNNDDKKGDIVRIKPNAHKPYFD